MVGPKDTPFDRSADLQTKEIAEAVLTSEQDRQHYFFLLNANYLSQGYIGMKRIYMPFYVYIISSEKLGRFYVGQTSNLSKRIFEHNQGMSVYTSRGIPWQLECVIEKPSLREALALEKKLKNIGRHRKIDFIRKYQRNFNKH